MSAENDKLIWDALITEINNPYGVAGLMGNLMAESSMNPINATGKYSQSSPSEYVAAVKNGTISPYDFSHDGVAFGLAQWRYWSRKGLLLSFTGADRIDDPVWQIKFLIHEIQSYSTVWNTLLNARSVKEASDIVMVKYEKPATVSDAAKKKRAAYGEKYFQQFAVPQPSSVKYVVTTADKVNIRSGDGMNFMSVSRAEKSGTKYEWVATAPNGWHAVRLKDRIAWISGKFSEVVNG